MLKIITNGKNGILWQKGDNKGVFPIAFYFEMRWVKSLRHFYADEYDAWNAKIGLVPHSVFSPHLVVVYFYVCYAAPWRNISLRFQKRIDISCGIYGIAYCYFLEKKRLLSWAVRATFTPLLAALDHRENEEKEIFCKIGAEPEIDFLYLHLFRLCGISYFNTFTKNSRQIRNFAYCFFTQLYSCFLLFSPLEACNSSACGGRRWSLEIKNRIMGWNLKVYA